MHRSKLIWAGLFAWAALLGGCGTSDDGDTNNNYYQWNQNNNNNGNENENENDNSGNDNNSSLAAQATVNISGEQSASWILDNEVNSVYCLEDLGWLSLDAHRFPGSLDDSISFFIDVFTGPGSYSFNYDTMNVSDFAANVYVGSQYKYWFFYDYSRIDYHSEYSDCQISITQPEPDWYSGTITCSWFPAMSISADREDDPVEFQPYVNMSATFTCSTTF